MYYTIPEFLDLYPIGRSTFYRLVQLGQLRLTKNAFDITPELYSTNLEYVARYCVKGASIDAAMTCRLRSCMLGGKVIGKRFGMSKNLSRAKFRNDETAR